jgi:MFS family permease
MDDSKRNVLLLAACQALLLTNAVTLISVAALAGYSLAENKVFATLPATSYVIASMWMRRVGRRGGFLTGAVFGLAGSAIAAFAMSIASLPLLCFGTMLLGTYNAFGQYYRFAAADAAPPDFKAKAISYVMAGGLIGGIIGPEASKHTRELVHPTYVATYASLFVLCLVAMGIVWFLRIPKPAQSVFTEPARPLVRIMQQPVFIVAAAVGALGYGAMNLLMTATPLAMGFCGLPYSASASVIAAHVVAMFGPSFFTGSLIKRFGVLPVMLAGVVSMLACIAVGLSGQLFGNFWGALVLLGIGWNFMYIGGTTLLTDAYRPAEKAKVQGANEVIIFATLALSSFASGVLVNTKGWDTLNLVSLALMCMAGGLVLWGVAGIPRPKTASG